jgi:hypoxanthine phosphoribosyltransferase
MDIGLVTLVVADYDEAIAFYVDKVGFDLVEDSPSVTDDGEPKRWVVVRPPGATTGLVLGRASTDTQRSAIGHQAGGRVGFFLHTDDFDAQHQRMVEAGVTFVGQPRDEPYGRVAVWEDLYGNRWDLVGPATTAEPVPVPILDLTTAPVEAPAYPPPEDLGDVLLSEEAIAARIQELGRQLAADYAGQVPLLVAVLKGSMVFVADLMRAIEAPLELDFLAVSSYGAATKSSGVVRIVKDLDQDVSGRHVVLVEDIVDSGLTLRYLLDHLSAQNPASLRTCSLLLRQGEQVSDLNIDYVGFELPPAFVIGFGLDVGQRYRNLPYIASYAGA